MQHSAPPQEGGLAGLVRASGFTRRAFATRVAAFLLAVTVPLILFLPALGAGDLLNGREATSASGWASLSSADVAMTLVAFAIAALLFGEQQQHRSRDWLLGTAALAFVLVGLAWPEMRQLGNLGFGLRIGAYAQLLWAGALALLLVSALRDPTPRGPVSASLLVLRTPGGGATPVAPAVQPDHQPAHQLDREPAHAAERRPGHQSEHAEREPNEQIDSSASGTTGPTARPESGWYADPRGVARLRYFDGTTWTDHTAD